MATIQMGSKADAVETEEGKEVIDDGDEEIVPPQDEVEETTEESSPSTKSDEETEADSEKADESAEETEEKTPDEPQGEESNAESEVVDDKKEWDVEGLKTEKERIAQEIVELRKERRTLKEQPKEDLFVDKEDLSDVAPSDIALIKKVLKAEGFVHKNELQAMTYKEKLDSYKDSWLDKHPEYKPENDPEDKMWNALNNELNSYYKAPSNPADIVKILDRANLSINPKKSIPVKSGATVAAAQEKIKSSSKGAGGTSATKESKPDSELKSFKGHLKGFTDTELDEILN